MRWTVPFFPALGFVHLIQGALKKGSFSWRLAVVDWVDEERIYNVFCCFQLFCNPMGCRLPGSSVHGISQARMLWWVVISFSMGSSQPRDWIHVPALAGRFFTTELLGKASDVFTSKVTERSSSLLCHEHFLNVPVKGQDMVSPHLHSKMGLSSSVSAGWKYVLGTVSSFFW